MERDYPESYSFSGEEAAAYLTVTLKKLADSGVNADSKEDLKKGLYSLFNVELYNMPDLNARDYILASNHISDFDAIILGLLHNNIKILAKKEWVDNERLMSFVSRHYDLIGVDRRSSGDMTKALMDLYKYLNSPTVPKHVLIFPQGTISDINKNSVDRVYSGIFNLSYLTKKPILPIFLEQPSLTDKTRIVFGSEIVINDKADHRADWLEAVKGLQEALSPPPRTPKLSHKHANNNKIGDLYF